MYALMRSKAAFWAGAGALAMAGVATSLAAAGNGSGEVGGAAEPAVGLISAAQMQIEPSSFEVLQEAAPVPEPNEPGNAANDGDPEDGGTSEVMVRGIRDPESPACENNGCGEVVNAGGVTLHLPQPAVDGINRAAENRAAAKGEEDDAPQEADAGAGSGEDTSTRGVPADSPACEKHGCAEVETPGGVTVNVPQPAADGMARARENRENAGKKGDGSGADDDPDAVLQSTSGGPGNGGGKPDWAGPPAGKGPGAR